MIASVVCCLVLLIVMNIDLNSNLVFALLRETRPFFEVFLAGGPCGAFDSKDSGLLPASYASAAWDPHLRRPLLSLFFIHLDEPLGSEVRTLVSPSLDFFSSYRFSEGVLDSKECGRTGDPILDLAPDGLYFSFSFPCLQVCLFP